MFGESYGKPRGIHPSEQYFSHYCSNSEGHGSHPKSRKLPYFADLTVADPGFGRGAQLVGGPNFETGRIYA